MTMTKIMASLLLIASTAHGAENSRTECPPYTPVPYSALTDINHLPNPFITPNGDQVTRDDQWPCQREFLSQQLQHWVDGEKPKQQSEVIAEVNARSVTIKITNAQQRIAFTAEITLPPTGSPPYPAIIGVGRSFLDNQALLNQGIAIIDFPNNELGEQWTAQSRGKGKFYALFGADHSAASTVAWAWGVSRLIDGLQQTKEHQINTDMLGITGCSRNGKGALVTAALDERIALAIIQESGSGGSASWRVSEAQKAAGENVQTARQIVTENTWLRTSFAQFSESINKLPVDNHELMGLVAPRGLLLLENTDMEWLGNKSAYLAALGGREIYQALGATDHIGFTQTSGHQHCELPDSQKPAVNAFVSKFLQQKKTLTQIFQTDGNYVYERERWIPWSIPSLID